MKKNKPKADDTHFKIQENMIPFKNELANNFGVFSINKKNEILDAALLTDLVGELFWSFENLVR